MKTFLLGACLFLLSIYIKTSCCEEKSSHVLRIKRSSNGQSFKETFNMFIKEKGSQFDEKVIFDMAKRTVTHHVPAHRNLPKADFMIDFDSNVTVTRLPENGFCYIRPRPSDQPSMDLLKKSMDMVSSGKYKIREGDRVFSNELMSTGLADRSKLSKNVIKFCRGFPTYMMKNVEQDGVTVSKGVTRTKRQSVMAAVMPWPSCEKKPDLSLCANQDQEYDIKCKFTKIGTCVHWITCPGGLPGMANRGGECIDTHIYNKAICCYMSCPSV